MQVSELQQKFAKMRLSHLELRYRYNQVLMQLELFLGRCLGDLGDPDVLKTPPPPLPR